jgi:hypothetical protein
VASGSSAGGGDALLSFGLGEAESVLVTYCHVDRVGLAAEIQETRGAMV